MIQIHDVAQGTPEWKKLRSGKITASNAWRLLSGDKNDALATAEIKPTRAMRRGSALEHEAIELYETIYNVDVLRVGFVANDNYPICGASPDGIAGDTYIEVKCFNADKHCSMTRENIPFEVMAQVQFGMMICELQMCHLVLYNPDVDAENAFRVIPIERIDAIIINIQARL
jgi:hypothetical protein